MSDPRDFEGDPNFARGRTVGRQSNDSSGWIIAAVIVVIVLGLAAYSYKGSEMASSGAPETTSGQSTRAPVPKTPPSAPVVPAQPSQSQSQ
jgi:hypothetical protein